MVPRNRMKSRHEHWVCWMSTGRKERLSCDKHTRLFIIACHPYFELTAVLQQYCNIKGSTLAGTIDVPRLLGPRYITDSDINITTPVGNISPVAYPCQSRTGYCIAGQRGVLSGFITRPL